MSSRLENYVGSSDHWVVAINHDRRIDACPFAQQFDSQQI